MKVEKNKNVPKGTEEGNEMLGIPGLRDILLEGKVESSVYKIIVRLYCLTDLKITANLKSNIMLVMDLISSRSLTTKEEQEINNLLDKIVMTYNQSEAADREKAIEKDVERICEITTNSRKK